MAAHEPQIDVIDTFDVIDTQSPVHCISVGKLSHYLRVKYILTLKCNFE